MNRFLILIGVLLFNSCSHNPKIEITKEYIINSYWDEYNNAIYIEKMKVMRDSLLDINSNDFNWNLPNHWNITNKLNVDSTFMYSYSNSKELLPEKVYFNNPNGFYWNFGPPF
jgi:hypothetical protein